MGSCCSQDLTPKHAQMMKAWSRTYTKRLAWHMKGHSAEKWYQETSALATIWESSPASSLIFQNRWRSFSAMEDRSPCLRFSPEGPAGRNMFALVSDDFSDNSTPIGAILSLFITSYSSEFRDLYQETVTKKDKSLAESQLSALCTLLLQYTQILKSTSLVLYNEIAMCLARRQADLESLFLTHLLEGPIGRIAQELAEVVMENDNGNKGNEAENNQEIGNIKLDILQDLRNFAESENFAVRKKLLFGIDKKLEVFSDSQEAVFREITRNCDIPGLQSGLYVAKLLLVEQPACLSALLSALASK